MGILNDLLMGDNFFLIAGPCVIESKDILFRTAEVLKDISRKNKIPFVFKASFAKANRSSVSSFGGHGLEEGLKLLQAVKTEFALPVLTDIHESYQAKIVAEVVDILQIPAFLSRQTELIKAAALTGRAVNIKKGQFMAPEEMLFAAQKAEATGNKQIMLTERGTFFGYHNLVVDFRSFAEMQVFGYPVVYDVTHSLQKPAVNGTSGGTPQYALPMAKAALATGMVQGLFLETHPCPEQALSDAKSMLPLGEVSALIEKCLKVWKAK